MGEGVTRDRDATGRPRNARPRDELGRPLDRDEAASPAEDPPALAPEAALAEAQSLLDSGRAFTAHEVLEAVWKTAAEDERALWRGLAQLAVGLTHRARGNEKGAAALLRRGADTLAAAVGDRYDVPVEELQRWAVQAATEPAAPMPRLRR